MRTVADITSCSTCHLETGIRFQRLREQSTALNMEQKKTSKRDEAICPGKRDKLSLQAIRAQIEQTRGPAYWHSLEELAGSPEFQEMMHPEFPLGASEWVDEVSRRGFLKLMGASLAL